MNRWQAMAILVAGFLLGCGQPSEPLIIKIGSVQSVRLGGWGNGTVVSISVDLENQGKEAIHVAYDSVQLLTAEGDRGSLRAFRGEIKRREGRAASAGDRESALKPLLDAGFDRAVLEDLKQDVIEIGPGGRTKKVFAFNLARPTAAGTIELSYHDMDTDKMFRVSHEFRVR